MEATASDAWVVDDSDGTTWLLDLGDEVLRLAPSAVPDSPRRTFPGRRLRLVRCKHSGLVLDLEVDGPALAPSGRMRPEEVALGADLESSRYEGVLEDVRRVARAG